VLNGTEIKCDTALYYDHFLLIYKPLPRSVAGFGNLLVQNWYCHQNLSIHVMSLTMI